MELPANLASPSEPTPPRNPSSGRPEPAVGLESVLGHRFACPDLLRQALTHSSLVQEKQSHPDEAAAAPPPADNERLEFLGDAVLGLLTAESLYRRYPDLAEGDLTRLRGTLVSRRHLAEVASRLQLGQYLRLGRGEERTGGRSKSALLSNAMEAVLGALYLDGGLDCVRPVVETHIIEPSAATLRSHLDAGEGTGDFKSALQERLQAGRHGQPEYRITAHTGPDHLRQFFAEVRVAASLLGQGTGRTKKLAEQDAARHALDTLRTQPLPPAEEPR